MHEIPLLINIAVALVVAFVGGFLARRLGLPPIVGYLLAGVVIGPFTPGFVGEVETISQLAELGVIFLMFGVGLHFSLHDLWQVRDIAIPGAIGQMALATGLGYALTRAWGWSSVAGHIDLTWVRLGEGDPLVGQTLAQAGIRAHRGLGHRHFPRQPSVG